jgi:hypothetical protein
LSKHRRDHSEQTIESILEAASSKSLRASSVNPCGLLMKIYGEHHDGFAFALHIQKSVSI